MSEAVILTSIHEGFGLPYLEATVAGRPFIARSIPNVAPDLEQFGFHFPQSYEELLIDPCLFDWGAERKRQHKLFRAWRRQLPLACRHAVGQPVLLGAGNKKQPVPFSRLTLTAQLEVLAQPLKRSWEWSAPLNPFLTVWSRRAATGQLQITSWPQKADTWLSGQAFAQRFQEMICSMPQRAPAPVTGIAAQNEFIHEKLGSKHLFPLLWSRRS